MAKDVIYEKHHRHQQASNGPQPSAPPHTPVTTTPSLAKLSLTAQFDDMCRFSNSLTQYGALEDTITQIIKSHDEMRHRYSTYELRIKKLQEELEEAKSDKKVMDMKLQNVRHALVKQVNLTESLTKERDQLRQLISTVKHFFLEEEKGQTNGPISKGSREKLISCLNVPQLETVHEVDSQDSREDASLDGILDYDKTDDDIFYQSQRKSSVSMSRRRSSAARKSTASRNIESSPSKANVSKRSRKEENEIAIKETQVDTERVEEAREAMMEMAEGNDEPVYAQVEKRVPNGTVRTLMNENHISAKVTPVFKSAVDLKTLSSSTLRRVSGASLISQSDKLRQYHERRLENRGHNFTMKKVFRPGERCGPCEGAIRFCSNCYKCNDCNATAHPECRDKVPLPCIPITRNQPKNGRLTLVADFVNHADRPKIPALIVHVCSEIEKRGLTEVGLYRVNGADKEIKELKDKILKSKTGMPSLTSYDVLTLCGVVKDFLKSFDDPLLPRSTWNDLARAADMPDPDDKQIGIYQVVSDLPDANRDTLAFLMLHFQRVADSPSCKMPKMNLAKILGPTLVGTPPHLMTSNVLVYVQKQIAIMTLLFDTPTDYWNSLLNPVFHETSPKVNGNAINENGSEETRSRRSSIGLRTIGGTVTPFGLLTPARGQPVGSSYGARKPLYLKPLF